MLVISIPLSETVVIGFPHLAMRLSSSRPSRVPDRDVSETRLPKNRYQSSPDGPSAGAAEHEHI